MKDRILRLLSEKDYVPANVPEILRHLRLQPSAQQELQATLSALEASGRIARIKGNRYVQPLEADLIPGRIRMTRQGKGFVTPDDPALKEIAVNESGTGTALHEDRVLVRRDRPARGIRAGGQEFQDSGTVIRILERRRMRIVGTLKRSARFLYVIPDDPRIPHDIYVPEPRDVGRKAFIDDKVVVELGEWESRHTNPEGEIVEVLGAADAEGVDMLSVLRQYDLPLHFPREVLDEARAIGSEVHPRELAGREDCRRQLVVTIDPDDAKDFDDAICLERGASGHWKLWVHIADVSHYVRPDSPLDVEARRRGNSTYLVDRVIPMLPEALSNELCSLKPNVDRLTKCVEFLVNDEGRVLKTRFFPAVIHSQRRFSYRDAFAVLQRKPEGSIERMLHDANDLAQRIRRLRFKAGALDLDFPEMKIRLDDQGRVDRIEKIENDVSHQLIEEFMLLANEAVAAQLSHLRRPAIHRVHEDPDVRRLQEYREDILGHRVPCGNLVDRMEVQKLLHRLGTLSIGPALKIGFLKSLKRARYAEEPLGHYGLAKRHYAHFTSPIRRYADLAVHRALFEPRQKGRHSLRETADHISITERNSADAERDSKDVKLYAFLTEQLESGQPLVYPALVTDVRNFGFFVDVTGLAMGGLVPLSGMEDDFYVFDPDRHQVVGRRTRRTIKLSDRVEVQVARVDRFKKQVDFRLAPRRPTRPEHPVRPVRTAGRQDERVRRPEPTRSVHDRRPAPAKASRPPQKSHGGKSAPIIPSSHSRPQSGRGAERPGASGQRPPSRGVIPSSVRRSIPSAQKRASPRKKGG